MDNNCQFWKDSSGLSKRTLSCIRFGISHLKLNQVLHLYLYYVYKCIFKNMDTYAQIITSYRVISSLGRIWKLLWNQDGGETLCRCISMPYSRETGSLDTTPVLSSNPHPHPCPHQSTLNKPWSSAAQTAARCHTLDPLWQHWVTEADNGLCVPSNIHVSVKDCQIVSNSSHPTLKYLIIPPSFFTHTHRLAQYSDLSDPGGCGSVQRRWQLRLWHANMSGVDEVMLWIKSTFDTKEELTWFD